MFFLDSFALVYIDADASAQGQADVLLGALPELRGTEDVFP